MLTGRVRDRGLDFCGGEVVLLDPAEGLAGRLALLTVLCRGAFDGAGLKTVAVGVFGELLDEVALADVPAGLALVEIAAGLALVVLPLVLGLPFSRTPDGFFLSASPPDIAALDVGSAGFIETSSS